MSGNVQHREETVPDFGWQKIYQEFGIPGHLHKVAEAGLIAATAHPHMPSAPVSDRPFWAPGPPACHRQAAGPEGERLLAHSGQEILMILKIKILR